MRIRRRQCNQKIAIETKKKHCCICSGRDRWRAIRDKRHARESYNESAERQGGRRCESHVDPDPSSPPCSVIRRSNHARESQSDLALRCFFGLHCVLLDMTSNVFVTPRDEQHVVQPENTSGRAIRRNCENLCGSVIQSDLSFFFGTKGTLLLTADPMAETPPATADTLPLTSPTPAAGTVVTTVLVTS